ncbi:replicative DNA helicase [Synechocystis sp. FACHB-383]|uniref:replicative DNA helicase n=1 Tax=Synechocystis sp. FACHB-383 TaxID=2692864 RepID=UPI001682DF0C|nr:replicative DNA helicase [Synechocystis sp. FACHB-383]
MDNKLPPQNIEAEEAILGGILLDPAAIARIVDVLEADAFYVHAHRVIYRAMVTLHSQSQPTDLMFVATYLQDHHHLEAIGGMAKLTQLLDRTISAVNIDRFAALVIEKYKRRQFVADLRELESMSLDPSIPWDEVKKVADSKLTAAIADTSTAKGLKPISEFLPVAFQELEGGSSPGVPTGLGYLDQCLGGGIRPGKLIVIAGRPSMGKTFVGQFFSRLMAQKSAVAMFSMEMDALSIVRRFWAAEARIPQAQLTANAVPIDKSDDLVASAERLSTLPIYIDDTPGSCVTVQHIESQCHSLCRQHGSLGLIVVDYLQLIGDQGSDNRSGELGRYSSALKSLSKIFGCPVIALSQLNRGVEARNNKRPLMSDIRNSGAIEQDADVIIMLYRDEYYNPDTPDSGILELIIAKNRDGKSGVTAKVLFDPSMGTLKNLTSYAL